MYGEIDLETYTLSIIRLNTAFEKLENTQNIGEIKTMFEESYADLNSLYKDIVDDLNHGEVNFDEYYLFFQNGKQIFPQYIEALGNIENNELQNVIGSLINVFNNLDKIADGFIKNDGVK